MTREQIEKGKSILRVINTLKEDLEYFEFIKEKRSSFEIKTGRDDSIWIKHEENKHFLNKMILLRKKQIQDLEKQFNDL